MNKPNYFMMWTILILLVFISIMCVYTNLELTKSKNILKDIDQLKEQRQNELRQLEIEYNLTLAKKQALEEKYLEQNGK